MNTFTYVVSFIAQPGWIRAADGTMQFPAQTGISFRHILLEAAHLDEAYRLGLKLLPRQKNEWVLGEYAFPLSPVPVAEIAPTEPPQINN